MARILVIEDAEADMKLIESVLRHAGHITLGASDAETGMVLARALLPELIIMDFQLPGMDGLAATRQLKDHTQTRYIPVIALTLPIKGAEERIRAAGCDGYLVKPLCQEGLRDEVAQQICRHNIVA
jgi:two-component system cell cycle response regulator DivK